MRYTFSCGCGALILASDEETLAWGVETHDCSAPLTDPFAAGPLFSDRDAVEMDVIHWLCSLRGEPFWWFREGSRPLCVS